MHMLGPCGHPRGALSPVTPPAGPCRLGSPEGEVKIKRRPVKPGTGKLEKVPARRKAGSCEEGGKKKLKAKPKESLRSPTPSGSSASAPASSLFTGTDPRHFGPRDEGARLASERLKKATRKSKVLQSALRVSAGGRGWGAPMDPPWTTHGDGGSGGTMGCRGMGAGAGGAGVVGVHQWDRGDGGSGGTVGRRVMGAGAAGAAGAGGHRREHGVQGDGCRFCTGWWHCGATAPGLGVLRWLGR